MKCPVCDSAVKLLDGDFVCDSCTRRIFDCQCLTPNQAPQEKKGNIQVELTDSRELHCFKLVLNPKSAEDGSETTRLEILLHATSVVELVYKLNVALCAWQHQTTAYVLDHLRNLKSLES